jgi:hypothetical protein
VHFTAWLCFETCYIEIIATQWRANMANLFKTKLPMTKEEAITNIETMRRKTKDVKARIRVVKMALGPFGNLTDAAKNVYKDALLDKSFVS